MFSQVFFQLVDGQRPKVQAHPSLKIFQVPEDDPAPIRKPDFGVLSLADRMGPSQLLEEELEVGHYSVEEIRHLEPGGEDEIVVIHPREDGNNIAHRQSLPATDSSGYVPMSCQ